MESRLRAPSLPFFSVFFALYRPFMLFRCFNDFSLPAMPARYFVLAYSFCSSTPSIVDSRMPLFSTSWTRGS